MVHFDLCLSFSHLVSSVGVSVFDLASTFTNHEITIRATTDLHDKGSLALDEAAERKHGIVAQHYRFTDSQQCSLTKGKNRLYTLDFWEDVC